MEFVASLFEEEHINFTTPVKKMATAGSSVLAALRGHPKEIAEYAARVHTDLTPPGHMQADKVMAYWARIYPLFPNMAETVVQLGLAAWAIVNDVGGTQDFGSKPDIVIEGLAVKATLIFGDIIPVTNEGEPRQFCAAAFENDVDVILQVYPNIRVMLAARCAAAGLTPTDPSKVISFVKGVTPNTVGSSAERYAAKHNLLRGNAARPGLNGANQVAAAAVHSEQQLGFATQGSSGHNLF